MRHSFALLATVATLAACPPVSVARGAAFSADQIAAFHSILDQGEATRELLTRRVACLNEYIAGSRMLIAGRERALGDARRREMELMAQVSRAEDVYRDVPGQHGLRETQVTLDGSQKALSKAQQDFTANQKSIVEMEGSISKTEAANADLNLRIRAYDIRLHALANAMEQAGDLDPADVRLRQIDRLSVDLGSLVSDTPTFIELTEHELPEGAKARCSR